MANKELRKRAWVDVKKHYGSWLLLIFIINAIYWPLYALFSAMGIGTLPYTLPLSFLMQVMSLSASYVFYQKAETGRPPVFRDLLALLSQPDRAKKTMVLSLVLCVPTLLLFSSGVFQGIGLLVCLFIQPLIFPIAFCLFDRPYDTLKESMLRGIQLGKRCFGNILTFCIGLALPLILLSIGLISLWAVVMTTQIIAGNTPPIWPLYLTLLPLFFFQPYLNMGRALYARRLIREEET